MKRFCKSNYAKIDLYKTITLLRDERIAKREIIGWGLSINLSTMLFIPEDLDFWVAISKEKNTPASWGPIVGFNLRKEIGKGDKQLFDAITFPPGKK